jgi:hypothetical protein
MTTLALILVAVVILVALAGLVHLMSQSFLNWMVYMPSFNGLVECLGGIIGAIVRANE